MNTRLITTAVRGLLVGAVLAAGVAVAWTGPTAAPPNGNVPGLLHVGTTAQTKNGNIGINGLLAYGNILLQQNGYLNWGSTSGSSGYGIRDAGGILEFKSATGTWQTIQSIVSTAVGSSTVWTPGTNGRIYYTAGGVHIGSSAAPSTMLDVAGTWRLSPQSAAPVVCDASRIGSIAVSNATSHICICNGTSWIYDYNGAVCVWSSVSDPTPPTVALTAPANGATVSGTISVTATASDNIGVIGVQFKRGGVNLGAEDTTSPYSTSWDTTSVSNGSYALTAVARDAAGNMTTSAARTVTVSNTVAGSQTYSTPGTYSFTVPAYTTLTVQVWGGGGGGTGAYIEGTSGASSQFGATVIAGGGGNGGDPGDGGGGTASGGTTNTSGGNGSYTSGGNSPNGGAGGQPGTDGDSTGNAPGGGGGPLGEGVGQGGGGGAYSTRTYSAGQLSGSITVVVGAGGNGDNASWNGSYMGGGDGANGRVYITWN